MEVNIEIFCGSSVYIIFSYFFFFKIKLAYKRSLKYHYLAKFGGIVSKEEVEHAIDIFRKSRNLYQFIPNYLLKSNKFPWYFDQTISQNHVLFLFLYCFFSYCKIKLLLFRKLQLKSWNIGQCHLKLFACIIDLPCNL